jgi:NitT/TauT family transport system substrate-binding protein
LITAAPPATAFTTEYAQAALDALSAEGIDVTGEGYTAIEVALKLGGV